MSKTQQRNQRATCYCGNLDLKVTEELLWELMLQVGPIESVYIPKDKVTGAHQGFGFVEFRGEADRQLRGASDEYGETVRQTHQGNQDISEQEKIMILVRICL